MPYDKSSFCQNFIWKDFQELIAKPAKCYSNAATQCNEENVRVINS